MGPRLATARCARYALTWLRFILKRRAKNERRRPYAGRSQSANYSVFGLEECGYARFRTSRTALNVLFVASRT